MAVTFWIFDVVVGADANGVVYVEAWSAAITIELLVIHCKEAKLAASHAVVVSVVSSVMHPVSSSESFRPIFHSCKGEGGT